MSDSSPPEAPPERPLTFFSAAIWALIAMMINAIVANVTEEARPGAMIDSISRTGCLALAYSVVLFGVLRLHAPQASIRHVLGLRPPSILSVVLALAVGASLSVPSDWLDKALESRFPLPPEAEEEAAKAALAVTSVGKGVSLFITAVILDPILTELFYRGVLFTPLRRTYRTETVIIGVAALESLWNMSFSPRIAIVFLAATIVFSWVRGVTGSVIPAVAAHFAFNAVSVVPTCLRRPDLEPTKTILLASGLTAVASLIGLSLVSRSARAIDARQRDAGEVPL